MDDFSWARNIPESNTNVLNYKRWSTILLKNHLSLSPQMYTLNGYGHHLHINYKTLNLIWRYFAIPSFFAASQFGTLWHMTFKIKHPFSFLKRNMFDGHTLQFSLRKLNVNGTWSFCRVNLTVCYDCFYVEEYRVDWRWFVNYCLLLK